MTSSIRLTHPPNPAGKAVTKVVWRVNEAQENQHLDLSECQLMSIPDAIYHLMRNTVLLTCNLSSNVLKKLPPKFAVKFTNITDLNLSRNHLSTLPDELRDLPDLKKLDISYNSFYSLPRMVLKMTSISSLNAKNNSIRDVDVLRLKAMPSLHQVNLEENPLMSSCHAQLRELSSTRLAITVSQLTSDSDSDSDFEDGDLASTSPASSCGPPSSGDDQKSD